MIDKIEIKMENGALHGHLKFVDSDLSKEESIEMVSHLVSWKLGPVKPTRHFELVYNPDEERAEADVYVSITKPLNEQIDEVTYVFNTLIEFLNLYESEIKGVIG